MAKHNITHKDSENSTDQYGNNTNFPDSIMSDFSRKSLLGKWTEDKYINQHQTRVVVKASRKTILAAAIISAIGVIVCLFLGVSNIVKTSDYKQVKGVVTDVSKDTSYTNYSSQQYSRVWRIKFTYTVDSQEFLNESRIMFPGIYRKNQEINVYYDPTDPQVIRDRFVVELTTVLGIFCILFLCAMIIFYKNAKDV